MIKLLPADFSMYKLIKAFLAEFVGTFLFLFGAYGAVMAMKSDPTDTGNTSGLANIVNISMAFGFGLAAAIHCVGHFSGGNLNPAVSTGLMVAGKLSVLEWVFYVIFQCLGAMVAAGLVDVFTEDISGTCNGLGNLSSGEAFLMEAILTFWLVFTVFATIDPSSTGTAAGPLFIGLTVLVAHLVGVVRTGTSINPARSFGSAVAGGGDCWDDHWVFWIGPACGAIVAGLLYTLYFDDGLLVIGTRETFNVEVKRQSQLI
eukprot:m.50228 g.50228  ORF g.50228 m.50228 type:complete len:259 (-) comp6528_c0_seq1:172-948(-)